MIRALLADDEKMSRTTLRRLLELYCPSVEIIGEAANAAETKMLAGELKPDLVFLDIAMPGKTGIELLRELEQVDFEVIFVTAHDRFVLQAMRLAAVDYLSKPVDEQELVQAVSQAEKRIRNKTAQTPIPAFLHNLQQHSTGQDMQLCVPGVRGFQVLRIRDIVFCEADNTYTILHLADQRKLIASRPLLDYESLLQDAYFVRIHKTYLINLHHLKEYQKGEGGIAVMSNGRQLDVSRRRKDQFISLVKQYFKY